MDKGGVLGGQPLFRWEKLRKSLIKNSLSAPLIYRLNTRSIQILKGLNLRDRNMPLTSPPLSLR